MMRRMVCVQGNSAIGIEMDVIKSRHAGRTVKRWWSAYQVRGQGLYSYLTKFDFVH